MRCPLAVVNGGFSSFGPASRIAAYPPGVSLTAGTLCYVFGDRMVPPLSPQAVAPVIAATTIWSLREQGVVSLALVPGRFVDRPPDVGVAFTNPPSQLRAGLEHLTLTSVTKGRAKASEIVHDWLSGHGAGHAAHQRLIDFARQELVARELAEYVDLGHNKARAFFSGNRRFEPDHARLAAYREDFDVLWVRWSSFCATEPDLAGRLLAIPVEVFEAHDRSA